MTRKKDAAGALEGGPNARGEVVLALNPLEGIVYQLRPSREAISAIERKVGPLAELVVRGLSLSLTVEEMGEIAAEMMRAYGQAHPTDEHVTTYRNANPSRLADLIYEADAMKMCGRIAVVLKAAWTGGVTAAGEVKAAAQKTT
jgi:hypothetical protein